MKYVVSWLERRTGSAADHEAAQQRVLEALSMRPMPESLTIHRFVARVGLGGYAVVETDEPADLQYLISAYAPVCSTVEAVVDRVDAAAERRGSEWRDLVRSN